MRRSKFKIAIAVLVVIVSAVAFKANNYISSGSVYCRSTCPAGEQIAYKIDPDGDFTAPCPGSAQPYVWSVCDGTYSCVPTPSGMTFSPTTDQGN
jgi:hypothetical protein